MLVLDAVVHVITVVPVLLVVNPLQLLQLNRDVIHAQDYVFQRVLETVAQLPHLHLAQDVAQHV